MRRAKSWVAPMAMVGCLFLLAQPALASVENSPVRKLGRGIANLFTGWLEVPAQMGKAVETDGSIAAVTVGLGRGVVLGVGRTLVGAIELVTFPIPNPATGYGPVVNPEFVKFRDVDRW